MIFAPSTSLSESVLPAGLQLMAPLLLAGPLDEDASVVATLDLTSRYSALFAVGTAGQLFVLRLVRERVSTTHSQGRPEAEM